MRTLLFALVLSAASCIALAQDQQAPKSPPKPVVHHVAPKPAVRHAATTAAALAASTGASTGKISQSAATKNPILVLQQFSLTDLQAALADAQAQVPPDTVGANCYQALITTIQNPVANPLPAGPGLFQLLQKGRDAKNWLSQLQANNGPLSAINTGCAALILDGQNTLIQLGILSGAVVGTGGLLPLIPPLGQNGDAPTFLAYQQARDKWMTAATAE